MIKDFVFITDLHITSTCNVRTGDVVQDLKQKLQFVVDYANNHNATILIGGDVFDKPTVPDFVKSELAPIFLSANEVPFAIMGNHDQLFNSDEKDYKTSYHLWCTHKVIKNLEYEDFGEFVLHSQLPLKNLGKPQLVIFHGFLNKEDGKNTVLMTDLQTNDQVLLCLGHDHVVYDPIQLATVRVIRPGSLLRGIRADESIRIPNLVHIRVNTEASRVFGIKMVPIKCRDASEIFTTKEATITNSEKEKSYESIINSIRNSKESDMSLESALKTVTTPDVILYVQQVLHDLDVEKQNK